MTLNQKPENVHASLKVKLKIATETGSYQLENLQLSIENFHHLLSQNPTKLIITAVPQEPTDSGIQDSLNELGPLAEQTTFAPQGGPAGILEGGPIIEQTTSSPPHSGGTQSAVLTNQGTKEVLISGTPLVTMEKADQGTVWLVIQL